MATRQQYAEVINDLSIKTEGNKKRIQSRIEAHNGDAAAAFKEIGEAAALNIQARIEAARQKLSS